MRCVVWILAVLSRAWLTAGDVFLTPNTPGGLMLAIEDAAVGDTITLATGIYAGEQNCNLVLSKRVTIQSEPGTPSGATVIDCDNFSRCLTITSAGTGTVLRGISLINAGEGDRINPGRADEGRNSLQRDAFDSVSSRDGGAAEHPYSKSGPQRPEISERTVDGDSTQPDSEITDGELASALAKLSKAGARKLLGLWLELRGIAFVVASLPDSIAEAPQLAQRLRKSSNGSLNRGQPSAPSPTQNASLVRPRDEGPGGDCSPAPPNTVDGCSGVRLFDSWCGTLTEGSVALYPSNQACSWIIEPPGAQSVTLTFKMLDIENNAACEYDWLLLTELRPEGNVRLIRLCGTLNDWDCLDVETGGSESVCAKISMPSFRVFAPLRIDFMTDEVSELDGFELDWVASAEPVDGNNLNQSPLFGGCVLVDHAEVVFESLIVTGCVAQHGGGIALNGSKATIRNTEISHNLAWKGGGGVFADSSSIVVEDTSIHNNRVLFTKHPSVCEHRDHNGGGGVVFWNSVAHLQGSQIRSNSVSSDKIRCTVAFAAGIRVRFGTLTLKSCSVEHNVADGGVFTNARGGGLYCFGANVSISDSSLSHNLVQGEQTPEGGGLWVRRGRVSLSSTHLSYNHLKGLRPRFVSEADEGPQGGGLWVAQTHLEIVDCDVSGNMLAARFDKCRGGGLHLQESNLDLLSTRVTNNTLAAFLDDEEYDEVAGGGVHSLLSNISLVNSTLAANNCVGSRVRGCALYMFAHDGASEVSSLFVVESSVIRNSAIARNSQGMIHGVALHLEGNTVKGVVTGSNLSHNVGMNEARRGRSTWNRGGGISCRSCGLTVRSCLIEGNFMSGGLGSGGGISVQEGVVFVGDSRITGNQLAQLSSHQNVEHYGAGIYLEDSIGSVIATQVTNNSAMPTGPYAKVDGMGLYGRLSVVNVTFSVLERNVGVSRSFVRGTIYMYHSNFSLSSSHVSHNRGIGKYVQGVGVHLASASRCSISASRFANNSGEGDSSAMGSGLYATRIPSLDASFLIFSGNSAVGETASGGALRMHFCEVVVMRQLTFQNNSAVGSWRAYGGAVLLYQSAAVLAEVVCTNNVARARLAYGGGLFSQKDELHGPTQLTLLNVWLHANRVEGTAVFGAGLFLVDGIHTLSSVTVSSNRAVAVEISEAGGIAAGNSILTLLNCTFVRNSADTAGAILFEGSSHVSVHNCTILRNIASGVGGGIVLREGSATHISDTLVAFNTAMMVAQLFALGLAVDVRVANCTFVADAEFHALAQGKHVSLRNHTLWRTSRRGYALIVENRGESEILRFAECPAGSFLLVESNNFNRLNCTPCPVRARCDGADKVLARNGFWGMSHRGNDLEMYRCPAGYCCPREACFPFNFCASHRAGVLCGQCRSGYSESIGSPDCKPDDECIHFRWLLPCSVIAAGVVALAFSVLRARGSREYLRAMEESGSSSLRGSDGAEIEVIVFFFQVLPLVLSDDTRDGVGEFGRVVLSVFNLNLGAENNDGWCPYPGFTAVSKVASSSLLVLLCLVWLVVLAGMQRIVLQWKPSLDRFQGLAGVTGALFDILGLGYSALVKTTFQLLACVPVGGKTSLFRSAHIECYQPWQIALLAIAMPMLVSYPGFISALIHKAHNQLHHHGNVKSAMFSVLSVVARPFDDRRKLTQQWGAVLLVERLALITTSVFVSSDIWRSWGLVCLLIVMVVMQVALKPFRRPGCNAFMALACIVLTTVGAAEIGTSVFNSRGLRIPSQLWHTMGVLVAICSVVPLLLGGILMVHDAFAKTLWALWQQLVSPRRRGEVELTEAVKPPALCVVCSALDKTVWDDTDLDLQTLCPEHSSQVC